MATTGGGWRDAAAYDYFDDLTPEQTAFEFLRRDAGYVTAYEAAADFPETEETRSALAARRGLRFAVDPALRADERPVLWLPRHNPRLLLLTTLSASLVDGPTLGDAGPIRVLDAPEGAYLDLSALAPARQALLASGSDGGKPLALVLPLDWLFESRLEAGRDFGFEPARTAWLQRAHGLGQRCAARLDRETVEGVAEGLEADGALSLRLVDGSLRRITAGDVFFPEPAGAG